jgi:DNA-binding MarR family transcriptional regulator
VKKGTVVVIQSSQGELAAELGTTRSTLNRALHDFEGLGLVSVSGSQVTLLKPNRLLSYTHYIPCRSSPLPT